MKVLATSQFNSSTELLDAKNAKELHNIFLIFERLDHEEILALDKLAKIESKNLDFYVFRGNRIWVYLHFDNSNEKPIAILLDVQSYSIKQQVEKNIGEIFLLTHLVQLRKLILESLKDKGFLTMSSVSNSLVSIDIDDSLDIFINSTHTFVNNLKEVSSEQIDAIKIIFGWLLLLSIDERSFDKIYEESRDSNFYDLPVNNEHLAELILSRIKNKSANFSSSNINIGELSDLGWHLDDIKNDIIRNIYAQTFATEPHRDLDKNDLQMLNATFKLRKEIDSNNFIVFDSSNDNNPLSNPNLINELKSTLPDIPLIRYGKVHKKNIFRIPEETLKKKTEEFISFLDQVHME